jgi:plastocyanin
LLGLACLASPAFAHYWSRSITPHAEQHSVLVADVAAPAAQTHVVTLNITPVEGRPVPEFYFEPVGLLIQPGDTVQFRADTPHHTVTAYHELQGKEHRVPDGVEPFSSHVIPIGESWEYTFSVPGVYDVWCAPHESYGMVMRLVVGEASGPGTQPPADAGPFGAHESAALVLNDPAIDPVRIAEVGSVSWSEIGEEAKAIAEGH